MFRIIIISIYCWTIFAHQYGGSDYVDFDDSNKYTPYHELKNSRDYRQPPSDVNQQFDQNQHQKFFDDRMYDQKKHHNQHYDDYEDRTQHQNHHHDERNHHHHRDDKHYNNQQFTDDGYSNHNDGHHRCKDNSHQDQFSHNTNRHQQQSCPRRQEQKHHHHQHDNHRTCPRETFKTIMTQFIEYVFCEQTSFVSDRDSTVLYANNVIVPGWIAKPNEYPFVVFRRNVNCMGFLIRVNLALFGYGCAENLPFYLNFGAVTPNSDYAQTRKITSSSQIFVVNPTILTISFERITVERAVKPILISNADWYTRHYVKNGIEVALQPIIVDDCPTSPPGPTTWNLIGGFMNQVDCGSTSGIFPGINVCPYTKEYICAFRSDGLNAPCTTGSAGLIFFDELLQKHVLVGVYNRRVAVDCSAPNFRDYPKRFVSVSLIANATLYDRFWNSNVL
jgi:hypothetical protein